MRMGGGRNQNGGAMRSIGRAWILENGKPALVMFRQGATDGRFTQVLELGEMPNFGRMASQMEGNEEIQKALARKLTEGTKVIVDTEIKAKS